MDRIGRSLVVAALLTGCGGKPSSSEVELALEAAWKDDWMSMGRSTGLLSAQDAAAGANRGAGSSIRLTVDTVEDYGGQSAAELTRKVIGTGARLAGDFGVRGADSFRLNSASKWEITNLEILDARNSGEDYVARVRYDIDAVLDSRPYRIGADLVQPVRLTRQEGNWVATSVL